MRLPPGLAFRTKGQLAIDLISEVLADGIQLDFACGDEVYGRCTQLRQFLEERGQAYVLRVPSNFYLTVARGVKLTCKDATRRLGGDLRWEIRSAGNGAKGQRWYAWAWLATAAPRHYLLIRRHLVTGELAFHYCYVPASQPASLSRLVRAAGCRWPVEEDFRSGKGCFGSMSPRSGSTPRSPGTPCWSWRPWPSAPSLLPCCAAAAIPGRRRRSGQSNPRLPTPA